MFTIIYLKQTIFIWCHIEYCSCPVVAVCAACNAVSHKECFVLLSSTFRSAYAVPNMAIFCSSLMLCIPGVLFRCSEWLWGGFSCPYYYLYRFFFNSTYLKIFSASLLITFLYAEIVMSINRHVPFSLSLTTLCRLLLGMVLSASTSWIHYMVT